MPASRAIELADRLSSRSKIGRAVVALGTLITTSLVLPAGMNTSLCTRARPGSRLPSSAISENPEGGVVAGATATPVCDPTIEGTCMQAGVHEAHQQNASGGARGRRSREHRGRGVGLVERDAVEE